MKIRLNGTDRETGAATLSALIEELELPRQMVLIEQNGEAPPRADWEKTPLREGDRVEILRVAAGG